jgi:hypothetical protein
MSFVWAAVGAFAVLLVAELLQLRRLRRQALAAAGGKP